MKQKLLGFFMVGILLIGSAYAQTRRISGKVTSSEDGAPLSGVSVIAVGSASGGLTDGAGNYAFNAPADVKRLEFRFIGFNTVVIDIGGDAIYNVQLDPTTTTL